jgi:hypothetical protein
VSDVDGYVAELERALVGPRRAKRELLREVRDHLTDSVEAYSDAGLDEAAAQRRAVADFGRVAEIREEYQTELAVAQARRTALLSLAVIAVQPVVWQEGWPWFAGDADQSDGAFYSVLDRILESLGGVAIALAVLVVLACGVGSRYRPARRSTVRLTGVLTLATCVTLPVLALVLSTQDLGDTGAFAINLGWLTALLVTPLVFVARSARRCLAVG